ncbi:MAG: hypothetical protein M3Q18_10280 [Actinomycetota bacterium]|nr:hypothetical protein [Actinomycetota bacterium]
MSTLSFSTSYGAGFHDHVVSAGERSLRAAYELGRVAVGRGLSLLDLAEVHHEALRSEIRLEGVDAEAVVRAAGEFFLESVSAYEMVRRGFEEVRQAALLQQSRLDMLRQLSDFLADTSLVSNAPESLEEIMRLIAEHARELIGARLCVVSLTDDGRTLRTSSYSADDVDETGDLEAAHLSAVASLPHAPEERMRAELTSLDGKELGSLELFGKEESFTAVDKATLVHLSQVASAAVERLRLHMTEYTPEN